MSSASPTAPPSLVECKHWGRRTDLRQLVGGHFLRVPGISKNPKRPTFDLHCLRSGCCQERRIQGCCRLRRNHQSTTCPRRHTRCCSPWGPRGLCWDSTCLGHTNQDSSYAQHFVKCSVKQHANAAVLIRMSSACMAVEHREYSPLLLLFSEKIKRASFSHVRWCYNGYQCSCIYF